MKGKTNVWLMVGGLILGSAGVVLFISGSRQEKNTAQAADTNYTTNWTTTKVYQLVTHTNATATDSIGMGVAQWTVHGTIGSTTFDETWDGPDAGDISVGYDSGLGKYIANYTSTKWLGGYMLNDNNANNNSHYYTSFSLKTADPAALSFNKDISSTSYAGVSRGGAADCFNGSSCVGATGSYGFSSTYRPGGSNQTIEVTGFMMPLKWSVTGTIHQP